LSRFDLCDDLLSKSGDLSFSLSLQSAEPTLNGSAMRHGSKAEFTSQDEVFIKQSP
jgi:hypothetical protein